MHLPVSFPGMSEVGPPKSLTQLVKALFRWATCRWGVFRRASVSFPEEIEVLQEECGSYPPLNYSLAEGFYLDPTAVSKAKASTKPKQGLAVGYPYKHKTMFQISCTEGSAVSLSVSTRL